MEHKIKVFIADPSRDFSDLLRSALSEEPDMLVSGTAVRGDEAYDRLKLEPPTVLVTELLLPGLDGLSLLRRLKDEGQLPRTVVISSFVTDHMAQAVSFLGVEDYIPKPFKMEELIRRIRETTDHNQRQRVQCYHPAIRSALLNFGILPHLSGHQYLQEAISRALEDRNVLHGITKILYPDLAKYFHTTPTCVERSIRGAISKAWELGTPESRRKTFNGTFDSFSKTPTNARFIAAVAEFIQINFEKEDPWRA